MSTARRRSALILAAGLLAAAGLAACGRDLPASGGSGVTSDNRVTLYSGRSESLIKPVLDRFEQETGVSVEVRYGDTAQMAAQLLEEGDRTPADVFLAQDAGALGALAKRRMFAPLPAPLLARVAPQYRAGSGEWVGVTGRVRVLVYNPTLVPAAELPASVFELTGPQWRGKVGIAPTNGSFQAFVTAIRVSRGEDRAAEFLAGLKANQAQVRPNNGAIVEDVAAGKLAVGLVNHYYVYEIAKEKGVAPDALGARVHFFGAGDPGSLINVSGVGVLKAAGTDADAHRLVEYLLGTAAQTHFATEVFEYPLVAGVAAAPGLPAIGELRPPAIDLNDLDSLERTVEAIKEAGLA